MGVQRNGRVECQIPRRSGLVVARGFPLSNELHKEVVGPGRNRQFLQNEQRSILPCPGGAYYLINLL
jgi:hypothetical protein